MRSVLAKIWGACCSRPSLPVALAILAVAALSAPAALASPLYHSVILRDKPIGYWRLGDRAGSTVAVDSSGYGNNGTFAPCVQLGGKGAIAANRNTAAIFGQQPGCWMVAQPLAGVHAGDYTVEAWIKTTSTTKRYQTFLDSRSTSGEFSFDLKLYGTDFGEQALAADIGDGREWVANPVVPFAFAANTWYYVAMTVMQNGFTFYVNGQPFAQQPFTTFGFPILLWDPNHPLAVGGNPRYDTCGCTPEDFRENFPGTIDEPAIYDYALTGVQINAHYEAGVDQRPPWGWWRHPAW